MAGLPDWDELIDSGLNGLEQYLAWALVEMRRLAIAEGQQQVVRLAYSSEKLTDGNDSKYEAILKAEVNLGYDSNIALARGVSFLPAIRDITSAKAMAPNYISVTNQLPSIQERIDSLRLDNSGIDTLEKFLCYLLLAWNLSTSGTDTGISNQKFAFFDENPQGGIVKFLINLPLDYQVSLQKNMVLAAGYISPYREAIEYVFPSIAEEPDNNTNKRFSANNDSDLGNNSDLDNS